MESIKKRAALAAAGAAVLIMFLIFFSLPLLAFFARKTDRVMNIHKKSNNTSAMTLTRLMNFIRYWKQSLLDARCCTIECQRE